MSKNVASVATSSLVHSLKGTARSALRSLPWKRGLLERAALAPPRLKGRAFTRLFGALLADQPARRPIVTNLGLSNLRVELAPEAGPLMLFGRPEHYAGERGALELTRTLLRDSSAFVDVGAHRGYFTLFASAVTQGRIPIHYFEPNPQLYSRLGDAVTANRLEGVRGHPLALGAQPGSARFFVLPEADLSSSLVHPGTDADFREIEVRVDTFAAFARRERLHDALVKVDVENAELAFLAGVQEQHPRVRYLIMEVLGPAVAAGAINRIRETFGFHAYYIDDYTLRHSPDGLFTYVAPEYNWLFCSLGPAQLSRRVGGSRLRVVARPRS